MRFSLPSKRTRHACGKIAVVVVLALVTAAVLLKLLAMSWNQIFTVNCHDCDLFWAVAQGMLNGLTPYKDLFEPKPPGIFLLSSASLSLTGTRLLGGVATGLATLSLGLAPCFFAWYTFRRTTLRRQMFFACLGALFGMAMVYYVDIRTAHYVPEQFGAAIGTLFVLVIALPKRKEKLHVWRWQPLLAGLMLFGAVFMKEPFLLPMLAGALFLSYSVKHLIQNAVIPFAIASVLQLVTLIALGLLGPYLFIYLREMLGWRVGSGGSLWMRGVSLESYSRVIGDIQGYSEHVFGVLAVTLVGALLLSVLHQSQKRKIALRITFIILGVYLIVLSVFAGGAHTYGQHYLFPIPGYVALFFLFLKRIQHFWDKPIARVLTAFVTVLLLLFSVKLPTTQFRAAATTSLAEQSPEAAYAAKVDAVLDACDVDRYLYLGPIGHKIYGHTKHSPLGPVFFHHSMYLNEDHMEFLNGLAESLQDADIILYEEKTHYMMMQPVIDTYLANNFTKEPWPCVPKPLPTGMMETFYFRKR